MAVVGQAHQVAAAAVLLLWVGSACGRTGSGVGSDAYAGSETGDSGCPAGSGDCETRVRLQRAADILFVIDNSGSMGSEQGTLAANFAAFVEVLERDQVGADYRIGVTTTDLKGLRASSCRLRLEEFIWEGRLAGMDLYEDARGPGCLDSCAHETVPLLATTTTTDGSARVRPWLEKGPDGSNLPADIDMASAMQCIGPQGINGSGYEAPLESMRHVLVDDPAGFVRDDALLAIIFVTDEADCSMPLDHQWVLTSDAGRALWSDPLGDRPTSAACWNSGVACDGGPGIYDGCYSVDRAWDGGIEADPEAAVLFPIQRYVDTLRELARGKERRGGNGQVLVAVIAGVPHDYPDGGELVYRDSAVPEFNLEYGIGPGCDWGTEMIHDPPGIPPVRLREFAESFATGSRNVFSICSPDYTVALEDIATAIANLSQRACVPGCVLDVNPTVAGLQPNCTVREQVLEGVELPVERCTLTNDGWRMPAGAEVCYRMLGDADGSTRTPADDMTAQCITLGANLEVVLERADGGPAPVGSIVRVDCELTGPIGTPCQDP
jgi:hypothetical protein